MGIFTAAAATAIALGTGMSGVDAMGSDVVQCLVEPPLVAMDALSAAPLLVSAVRPPRRSAPEGYSQVAWGQTALRPYDVMSSLGSGGAPALPTALSLADAPAPLVVSNPLAWVLAGVGLLGMLYVRRTQF